MNIFSSVNPAAFEKPIKISGLKSDLIEFNIENIHQSVLKITTNRQYAL